MEPWTVWATCLLLGVAGSIPAAAQSTGLPPACIKMSHPEVVPVTVAGGVLTSPFFSDHVTYPTYLDCLWRLSTEDGFYPVVMVEHFDLQPQGGVGCRDAFIVHFPDLGPDRSEYGNFCGTQIPKCFYYAGRHIDIRFFTDGNTQSNTGWRITYNASRTPVCPTEAPPVLVSTIASNTKATANTGVGPTETPQTPTTPPGLTIMPSERPPLVGAIVGGTLACVAIVTMLLLWCFCCYWRRRKRPPQVAETLANPGARPDIVIFRNGEDRTSLMNPNYGQRAEFTALAAMSSNRGATPDNCYSGGDLKQPLLDGATSPGVESPRHTGPPKFVPPSPPAARHAGPPKFVPPPHLPQGMPVRRNSCPPPHLPRGMPVRRSLCPPPHLAPRAAKTGRAAPMTCSLKTAAERTTSIRTRDTRRLTRASRRSAMASCVWMMPREVEMQDPPLGVVTVQPMCTSSAPGRSFPPSALRPMLKSACWTILTKKAGTSPLMSPATRSHWRRVTTKPWQPRHVTPGTARPEVTRTGTRFP
ncbi:PREDICTED: uncharacterized protein LOC109468835 [Branchiostoma belcheri]|uniref:Uncharacterized protein LOC109468835 n=1 Tax=Branchiostoma belcheri TaxID=7741 RepID=A0A6P4YM06_BRABE|nr:PREDICTED: uncharacterized protein LOC109468835 [Branchiostoma belcheri]